MEWIVNSLANVILETLNDMLRWTVHLVEGFSLNIGYSSQAAGPGINASPFEEIFKLNEFLMPIMVLAFFIVFACAILKLYQAMGGPFTQSEEPGVIFIRTAFAGIGVAMSYSIFTSVEFAFNYIYQKFVAIYQTIGQQYSNADWNNILNITDGSGNSATSQATNNAPQSFNESYGIATAGDNSGATSSSNVFSVFGGDSLIKDVTPTMGLIIIEAIIGCTLIICFFKLVLEVYERYVLIGVMYITAPLAFSTLISKQSTIFKNWCQMLVCQFILMCMNLVFLGGFIGAWYAILAPLSTGQGYVFETEQKYFSTMFIMIGWLLAGQKMDEHLRSLGLSAATTGSGIMGAMMGGMGLAAAAFRMGSGAARSVGTNTHNAMTGQTKIQKAIQQGNDGKGGGLVGALFGNPENANHNALSDTGNPEPSPKDDSSINIPSNESPSKATAANAPTSEQAAQIASSLASMNQIQDVSQKPDIKKSAGGRASNVDAGNASMDDYKPLSTGSGHSRAESNGVTAQKYESKDIGAKARPGGEKPIQIKGKSDAIHKANKSDSND